jgi:hypothetical protein
MLENEFEKRMQEKMEDLKIRPSEAVWPNVEKELKRKKRRRVLVFFFLPILLGLAGYSIYTLSRTGSSSALAEKNNAPVQQSQGDGPVEEQNKTKEQPSTGTRQDHDIPGAESGKTNNETTNSSNKLIEEKPLTKKPGVTPGVITPKTDPEQLRTIQQRPVKKPGPDKPVIQRTDLVKDIPKTADKPLIKTDDLNKNEDLDKEKPSVQKEERGLVVQPAVPITNDVTVTNGNEGNINKESGDNKISQPADSIVNPVAQQQSKSQAPIDSIQENTDKQAVATSKKTRSKLKLGFDFSIGQTSRRNRQIPFFSEKSTRSQDIAFSAPPPVTTGVPPRVILPPSSIHSGLAFKLGVSAQLPLTRKTSISAGLRYAYLSERIRVGSYRDTVVVSNSYQFASSNVVSGLYSSAQQRDYTNKYHFLEMPLLYQLQLNKGKKMPILLSLGVTPAFLVGTNALLYDSLAGGIYYRDKAAFNKFHVNIQTGLSFVFGKPGKMQWALGPEFSFDMRKIMKQDVFIASKYMLYGGLSGRIVLPRKKKE